MSSRSSANLVLVGPDDARLLDHVVLDLLEQRAPVEPGRQIEVIVERVDPEVVMVRAVARGRRGAVVAGVAE